MCPSAEHTMLLHLIPKEMFVVLAIRVQSIPEFVETKMPELPGDPPRPVLPPVAANNLEPSADEATADQLSPEAFVDRVQLAPELVER